MAIRPDGKDAHVWLWCYNYGDDTWVNPLGMHINGVRHIKPDLLVCDDRLFLSSWVRQEVPNDRSEWSYRIREMNVEQRKCRTVFQMAAAEIEGLFQVPAKVLKRFYEPEGGSVAARSPFHLVGFGFDKHIEVLTLGFRDPKVNVVVDPRTGAWEKRMASPSHPAIPCEGEVERHELRFGTPMKLLLPACTQWVEKAVEASNKMKIGDDFRSDHEDSDWDIEDIDFEGLW